MRYSTTKLLLVYVIVCAIAGFLIPQTYAANRALLIGADRFLSSQITPLPGIPIDLEIMRRNARLLGFKDHEIKILFGKDATAAAVEASISNWLIDGVGADERALFYFSGHGTNLLDESGDESDQVDEALVMYDTSLQAKGKDIVLDRVLLDDRFNQLLAAIPSRNVLVLLDACHSGTATRSFILPTLGELTSGKGVSKQFRYAGMPVGSEDNGFVQVTAASNFIAISAARDNEKAIATTQGSVFTLGLRTVLQQAARQRVALNPEKLRDLVTQYINANTDPQQRFQPQLSGNPELQIRNFMVIPAGSGQGPVWNNLLTTAKTGNRFNLSLNKDYFIAGQVLEIALDIPHSGYLNVVNVGSQDNTTVLFPNKYHLDNSVSRGRLTIPTTAMAFELTAGAPYGPSLIVAFLTSEPLNFYNTGYNLLSAGRALEVFRALSLQGEMALQMLQAQQNKGQVSYQWSSAWSKTKVCDNQQGCN